MAQRVSFLLLALVAPGAALAAQAMSGAGSVAASQPAKAAAGSPPSTTLRPSLEILKQALDQVRVDKWKGSGALHSEAETNLASIRRDVDTTLPPLLVAADAAPGSAAKALPAYRNVEALYDVLLRVASAGRLEAPGDQSSALDQALASLDDGRRALGDRLQEDAQGAEKRVNDLQASLKAIPPPAPAAPPVAQIVCPTPPAKKKARPAAKPSTPPAASQSAPSQ